MGAGFARWVETNWRRLVDDPRLNRNNRGGGRPGDDVPDAPQNRPPQNQPAPVPPKGFTVKESKYDYFFGRVKHSDRNPDGSLKTPEQLKQSQHNAERSAQNARDLNKLGIDETRGGRQRLEQIFQEGLSNPEKARISTNYGTTITRTVEVPPNGAIDVKYFYPKGDLSATPEISTIIPKIYR